MSQPNMKMTLDQSSSVHGSQQQIPKNNLKNLKMTHSKVKTTQNNPNKPDAGDLALVQKRLDFNNC